MKHHFSKTLPIVILNRSQSKEMQHKSEKDDLQREWCGKDRKGREKMAIKL